MPESEQAKKRFQSSISTKEALEDLDFFLRTLQSVHPQLLAHVSPDDYLDMKHTLRTWIQENTETISLSSFIMALAKSAAFFKDGHTAVPALLSLFDPSDSSKCMLPFLLEYRLGDVVIGKTTEGLNSLSGQRLLRVNDEKLIDLVSSVTVGKREEYRLSTFVHFQRMVWYLVHLRTKEPRIVVTTENSQGNVERHPIDLLTFQDYDHLFGRTNPILEPSYFAFYDSN